MDTNQQLTDALEKLKAASDEAEKVAALVNTNMGLKNPPASVVAKDESKPAKVFVSSKLRRNGYR